MNILINWKIQIFIEKYFHSENISKILRPKIYDNDVKKVRKFCNVEWEVDRKKWNKPSLATTLEKFAEGAFSHLSTRLKRYLLNNPVMSTHFRIFKNSNKMGVKYYSYFYSCHFPSTKIFRYSFKDFWTTEYIRIFVCKFLKILINLNIFAVNSVTRPSEAETVIISGLH